MTVDTTEVVSGPYTPNGSTTVFSFDFKALTTNDVIVVSVDSEGNETIVSSSDYNVTLNSGAGGNVTFTTAPVAGPELYVMLYPTFLQESEFNEGEDYLGASHESSYDRGTQRDLWLRYQVQRIFPTLISGEPIIQTALNARDAAAAAANYFPNKTSGEAATSVGGFFSYPDGLGGLIYAERVTDGTGDSGGNSTEIAQAPTKVQIDSVRDVQIDLTDFTTGSIPSLTKLRRTVGTRDVTPAGTLTIGVDSDNFLVNTNASGRGGAYLVVPAEAPVTYFKAEFVIKSGGTSSPDQASFAMMPWTADITEDPYVVPATGAHMTYSLGSWTVDKIETSGGAITTYASGTYPGGDLVEDEVNTLEVAIVDGVLYRLINGQPMDLVSDPVLETLVGNFAGFQIFKNNTTDNEVGMKRLEYSVSPTKAREFRDLYNRIIGSGANAGPEALYQVRDDFLVTSLEDGEIGALGWTSSLTTIAEAAGAQSHPGIIALRTGTTSGAFEALYPRTLTNLGIVSMLDVEECAWVFRENAAAVTDYDIRVGLMNDFGALPGNGFYLELLSGDTNWHLVTRESGTETRTDTTIAGRTTDWLTLRLIKKTNGRYKCAIKVNGGTETETADVLTNLPQSNVLTPGVLMVNTSTNQRRLDLDYFSLTLQATGR